MLSGSSHPVAKRESNFGRHVRPDQISDDGARYETTRLPLSAYPRPSHPLASSLGLLAHACAASFGSTSSFLSLLFLDAQGGLAVSVP